MSSALIPYIPPLEPCIRVSRGAPQVIPTAVNTPVEWDQRTWRRGDWGWSSGVRFLTIPQTGYYQVNCAWAFDLNPNNRRFMWVSTGPSYNITFAQKDWEGVGARVGTISTHRGFIQGDRVAIRVYQNSGVNISCSGNESCFMDLIRLGD